MFDKIETILKMICALLLAAFLLLIFIDVSAREIFQLPIIWISDLALALFIWSIFLGAAIGYRRQAHFTVDIIQFKRDGSELILKSIGFLLSFAFVLLVFKYGIEFARSGMRQYSMMIGFRKVYIFAAIPTSMCIMILFSFERVHDLVTEWRHINTTGR